MLAQEQDIHVNSFFVAEVASDLAAFSVTDIQIGHVSSRIFPLHAASGVHERIVNPRVPIGSPGPKHKVLRNQATVT